MQACGRLVARMGEQDVHRDIAAGIEIDGGDLALVMGDLDDPAIDDRYVAARQIGLDIGRNVVTIGEDSQLVGPIVEQPDRLVRLRAGPDEAPMLAGDFKAVAIGAGHDGRAPALGKARNIRHLVGDAIAQDQAARPKAFAIASEHGEIVDGAGDAVGPGIDQPDRGIARQLLPRLGQDVQRWLVIVAEQTMRMACEAVARQAGIENGGLAAGTAELQRAGETGKAAADDDDVIHGDGLRVVDGGGWAGPGAQYRPAIRTRDGQRAGLRLLLFVVYSWSVFHTLSLRMTLRMVGVQPPIARVNPARATRICISAAISRASTSASSASAVDSAACDTNPRW